MHRHALIYLAMVQTVRQIISIDKARVQSQDNPCGIYGGQSGTSDRHVIRELLLPAAS
jgi:hypothetical protein